MIFIRKADSADRTIVDAKNGVVLLRFKKMMENGINCCFTTRMGGISKDHLSSMNLSFTRGDEESNVMENYRRLSEASGHNYDRFVLADQVHSTNVRVVTSADAGKGLHNKKDYSEVDGFMTSEKDLPLVSFYADCVPLFFADKNKKAVAVSHSGWKGTVNKMGKVTVDRMVLEYGCNREDIVAVIGPSICRDCYEVSEDVINEFRETFTKEELDKCVTDDKNGKYHLDLWKANEIILVNAGIKRENIEVTDICTCCNSDKLFSHRATHGKRGNLAGIISL